jgi:CRP-like cAMP-binding protein
MGNARILNKIFTALEDCRHDQNQVEYKEQLTRIIRSFAHPAKLFFIIRALYQDTEAANPFYSSLLAQFRQEKIITELEIHKDCGDGRFLMNAVLYLKSIGDLRRATRYLEIFSQSEYGMDSKKAAERVSQDINQTKRKSGEKVIFLLSTSNVIEKAFERALADRVGVETPGTERSFKTLINHLAGLNPEFIVVDNSWNQCKGIDFIRELKARKINSTILLAADYLSQVQKDDSFALGVRDYVQIPFTFEEIQGKVNDILERTEKARTVKKAKISLQDGEILFREGDCGDNCYIIQKGTIRIWRTDKKGGELVLADITAGEIFGEMAIIDASPRSASATAVGDTELLSIAEENFDKVFNSNPAFALKMIRILAKRLRSATNRIKELEAG